MGAVRFIPRAYPRTDVPSSLRHLSSITSKMILDVRLEITVATLLDMSTTQPRVIVITGAGGMGLAIARRLGSGHAIVLGDSSVDTLTDVRTTLLSEGHDAHVHLLDVASERSVEEFAEYASTFGPIRTIVHTAGVSPVQADPRRVVAVDVIGTALVLDHFLPLAGPGTVMVCIASMAGYMASVPADVEHLLATTPTHELGTLPQLDSARLDSTAAYSLAKRANQVRVRSAAKAWGAKGARVVSVSPGIISTAMGRAEMAGPSGDLIRTMIDTAPIRRVGTADDVAAAVEFLASDQATFITGIDLVVDGGATSML